MEEVISSPTSHLKSSELEKAERARKVQEEEGILLSSILFHSVAYNYILATVETSFDGLEVSSCVDMECC